MLQEIERNPHKITTPSLLLKTVTLTKESQSLFDYELSSNMKRLEKKLELVPSFIFIFRHNKGTGNVYGQNLKQSFGKKVLSHYQKLREYNYWCQVNGFTLKVHQPEKIFEKMVCEYCESLEKIYFIVRSLKIPPNEPQGYHLKTGQKLKVGRIEYEIIVGGNDSEQWINKANSLFHLEGDSKQQGKTQEDRSCRICLSAEEGPDGMFFCHPCDCSGSCSSVHFKCLAIWCQRKVKKEMKGKVTQYTLSKYQCQICKSPYPSYFLHEGKKYPLIEFEPLPQVPYLILLQQKTSPTFFILEYSQMREFRLGRSHQCEIHITQNSISRKHCRIQMHDEGFYLFDTKSKFGTLIWQDSLEIQLKPIKRGLQMGRTVITFEIKQAY